MLAQIDKVVEIRLTAANNIFCLSFSPVGEMTLILVNMRHKVPNYTWETKPISFRYRITAGITNKPQNKHASQLINQKYQSYCYLHD